MATEEVDFEVDNNPQDGGMIVEAPKDDGEGRRKSDGGGKDRRHDDRRDRDRDNHRGGDRDNRNRDRAEKGDKDKSDYKRKGRGHDRSHDFDDRYDGRGGVFERLENAGGSGPLQCEFVFSYLLF